MPPVQYYIAQDSDPERAAYEYEIAKFYAQPLGDDWNGGMN